MTKSLLSVLVAMRVRDGKMKWDSKVDLHEDGDDDRDRVTAQHLMDMTDGLDYSEVSAAADSGEGYWSPAGAPTLCRDLPTPHPIHMQFHIQLYGFTEDPARMLYMSTSTARFTRRKGERHLPETRWCYHSGATNVSRAFFQKRQSLPLPCQPLTPLLPLLPLGLE